MGICFALPVTLFAIVFSETFVFKKLAKSGMIAPPTEETAICKRKILFLKKGSPVYIIIAAVLCILIGFTSNLPHFFVEPIVFEDYESFKKYMATPMRWGFDNSTIIEIAPVDPEYSENEDLPDDTIYDDYYPQIEVTDDAGNVLFTFVKMNEAVARVTFSKTPNKLPIKVYTKAAWNNSQETGAIISAVLAFGIAADAVAFFVAYFFKAKKTAF